MTFLIIISCLNLLLGIYNLLVMNKAFQFTNTNIDSYAAKNELVIKAADRVVSAEKNLLKTVIESTKG